jgi:hypothetical protein
MDFSQDSCLSKLCNRYIDYEECNCMSPYEAGFYPSPNDENIYISPSSDYLDIMVFHLSECTYEFEYVEDDPDDPFLSTIMDYIYKFCGSDNIRSLNYILVNYAELLYEPFIVEGQGFGLMETAAESNSPNVLFRLAKLCGCTPDEFGMLAESAAESGNLLLVLHLIELSRGSADISDIIRIAETTGHHHISDQLRLIQSDPGEPDYKTRVAYTSDYCLTRLTNRYVSYAVPCLCPHCSETGIPIDKDIQTPYSAGFHCLSDCTIFSTTTYLDTEIISLFRTMNERMIDRKIDIVMPTLCATGNIRVIDYLYRHYSKYIDEENMDPLIRASENGHTKVLARLLPIYKCDKDEYAVLSDAACLSGNLGLVKYMIKRAGDKADIETLLGTSKGTEHSHITRYLRSLI